MKNTKTLWVIILVLTVVLAGIALKFIVLGSTSPANDGRTEVLLDAGERKLVLAEMRQLLSATQQITEGLADNHMNQIAAAASEVGMQATTTMDVRLKAKLPLAFKQLGFATHQAFDDIAAIASDAKQVAATGGLTEVKTDIQRKLAETMNLCVACHSNYQLPPSGK